MESSNRLGWRRCVWAGVAVILMTVLIAGMFPSSGGDFAPGYGVPIYAFEFARTGDDLDRVFGLPGDPMRAKRMQQMDNGNYADYGFMSAYGAFLALFFWAAAQQSRQRRWHWVGALVGLSAVSDGIENILLLAITADIAEAPMLEWLWLPVTIKFSLLLFGALMAGWWFFRLPDALWQRVGQALMLLAMIGVTGLIVPSQFAYLLAICIAPAWLAQFVYAIRRSR